MPALVLNAQRRPSSDSGTYPRAKHLAPVVSLRAGDKARLSPERESARAIERPIISRRMSQISIVDIARAVGSKSDRSGTELREGSKPLTVGELATLFDLHVGAAAIVEILEVAVRL